MLMSSCVLTHVSDSPNETGQNSTNDLVDYERLSPYIWYYGFFLISGKLDIVLTFVCFS